MRKPLIITERYINNLVSRVIKEQDEDEWVKVSPEQYLETMKYATYHAKGVSMMPGYRGKKIWITGDLNVSSLPISSLEGVYYVDGNLDISHTNISFFDENKVKGNFRKYGSEMEKIEERK